MYGWGAYRNRNHFRFKCRDLQKISSFIFFELLKRIDKSVEICAFNLGERLTELEWCRLLEFIDPAKKERIRRFRRWQDAHLSLFADLLVRVVIGQRNDDPQFGH